MTKKYDWENDPIGAMIKHIEDAYDAGNTAAYAHFLETNLPDEKFADSISRDTIEKCYKHSIETGQDGAASRIYHAARKANKLSDGLTKNVNLEILREEDDLDIPVVGIIFDQESERVIVSWRERGTSWVNSKARTPRELKERWGEHAENSTRCEKSLPFVRQAFEKIVGNNSTPEWERNLAIVALERLNQS